MNSLTTNYLKCANNFTADYRSFTKSKPSNGIWKTDTFISSCCSEFLFNIYATVIFIFNLILSKNEIVL